MRTILLSLLRLTMVAGLPAVSFAEANPSFPLADVISQVKKELAAAENIPGQNIGLTLDGVELNFAISQTVDANGKVTVGVPVLNTGIGGTGEWKAESSSSLTVALAPPTASITMSGVDATGFGITQAIVATRKQLALGLNNEPRLLPKKITLQFRFGVTRSGGATGEIKFLVFSSSAGGAKSSSDINTITLTFVKK